MDLKITKQVEQLETYAAENAEQIGAMKAFMKLNFGGNHTDKLPKLLDGSEKTPLEMLHKIVLHLAKLCGGVAQPTRINSLHKHVVRRTLRSENKKLYEKRVYVQKLEDKYWYTAEVRRIGFLWRGKWREITPAMQPTYKDAELLFRNYA